MKFDFNPIIAKNGHLDWNWTQNANYMNLFFIIYTIAFIGAIYLYGDPYILLFSIGTFLYSMYNYYKYNLSYIIMALQKLSDGSGIVLSIGSGKTDKKYINNHGKKAELQTLWLFTDKHSLPNTKYVKADDTRLSLTVPINQDDSTFEFFTRLDSLIEETVTDSAVHKFIIKKI